MTVLITAAQLIVGPAHERVRDGAVLVEGDIITAAGPRHTVAARAPRGCATLDYPHATLLPGLINCHVHLAFGGHMDALSSIQDEPDDHRLLLTMVGRAQQLLSRGVTTVRDLGDRGGLAARLRDTIERGDITGPRLLTATAPLTLPDGHCWFLGGEIDDPTDPLELKAAVRRVHANGADLVKVMVSGGATTPGGTAMWESQFTTDQLTRVVEEAHERGLPVAAHAHGVGSISAAVDAGVDTIEHCSWMDGGMAFAPRESVRALVDRIAEAGIPVCPAHTFDWQLFARLAGEEGATELLSRARWMADNGVRLIAGTDAGLASFTDTGLHRVTDWGFGSDEVLDMATTNAAHALGLGTTVGSLKPGFSADLLAVDGDPLRDLTALDHIELVVARGRDVTASPLTPSP